MTRHDISQGVLSTVKTRQQKKDPISLEMDMCNYGIRALQPDRTQLQVSGVGLVNWENNPIL